MKKYGVMILLFLSGACSAADTLLTLYRPYGTGVDQAIPVIKKELSGTCLSQSRLIVREDAWRCTAEGRTYDPCFVSAVGDKKDVLCPQSPWLGDSVHIVLKTPLNASSLIPLDMSKTLPWAIELANGERCQAVDSEEVYEGMLVHYQCKHHMVLMGHVQRCHPLWRMLAKTADGVKTLELKRVWF